MSTTFSRDAKGQPTGDETAIEKQDPSGGLGFRMDNLAPGMGELSDASSKPRKYNETIVFFAVLLVAAAAVLFGLRKVGVGPLSAGAAQNTASVDLSAAKTDNIDHTKILTDLKATQVTAQVPLEQVQRNPLKLVDSLKKETVAETPEDPKDLSAERLRQLAEARKQRITEAMATLRVHAILMGKVPVARISDGNYRVGDVIDEFFTVKGIDARNVQLEVDGEVFTLSLDDANANSNKSPRRR